MPSPPGPSAAEADAVRLLDRVRASPWLMAALRRARGLGLPHWCIGAGAVRNLIWAHLHDRTLDPEQLEDLDLAHHSPSRPLSDDTLLAAQLRSPAPPRWEVVNQARVHEWPGARPDMAPHPSLEAALASWPETATAVGVWLDGQEQLRLIAPYGVGDLMAGLLRRSPRADPASFEQRLQAKAFLAQWPRLRLVRDAETRPF